MAITPKQPMWMAGYAACNRPADGTLHDLWAKAPWLEDPAGQSVLLITVDLIGIDRELAGSICRQLQHDHGLCGSRWPSARRTLTADPSSRKTSARCTSHRRLIPLNSN